MQGDDPYQPPESLKGPCENRALSSPYWTKGRILILCLVPAILAVAIRLISFDFLSPSALSLIHTVVTLGVICKLTAISSKFTWGSGADGLISLVTSFVAWGMAQMFVYSIFMSLLKIIL